MPINAQGLSISVFVLRDAKIQKYFIQIIYKNNQPSGCKSEN